MGYDDRARLLELRELHSPFPGEFVLPAPGETANPVVLADDPGIARLEWDRVTDVVAIRRDGADVSHVNASLTAYIECARLFTAGLAESGRIDEVFDDPEAADQAHSRHGARLLASFRDIDASAVRDENGLWAVAAKEIGGGML